MSKLLANKITRNGKDIILTTNASNYHLNMMMNELNDIDMFEVTIKKHKESRSNLQNKMFWAICEKISLEINYSRREEDVMNIYRDILQRANVKYVIVDAITEAKTILEQNFRYVKELPNSSYTKNGFEFKSFKCYIGSSKFDTKQMGELIDCALDYAQEVGVIDSEILSIKQEYRL